MHIVFTKQPNLQNYPDSFSVTNEELAILLSPSVSTEVQILDKDGTLYKVLTTEDFAKATATQKYEYSTGNKYWVINY